MANIFYISDTHFGHANILTFTSRPFYHCTDEQQCDAACKSTHPEVRIRPQFSCVEEMDEHMVDCWNRTVGPKDHVYHIGDVGFGAGLRHVGRLNGLLRLILGNHDQEPVRKYQEAGFKKVFGARRIDGMLLTHYPIHPMSLSHKVRANLHGHIHEKPSPPGMYLNLSVEAINYTPVPHEEVCRRVAQLAERWALAPEVTGSKPVTAANF